MLDKYQLSDLIQFQQAIEDEHIKDLLHTVLYEYSEYIRVGSPVFCQNLKEFMSYSPLDYLRVLDDFKKAVNEFYEPIKPKKKRGRPPKKKDGE